MADRTINWIFRATDRTSATFRSIDSRLAGITRSFKAVAGFTGFAAIGAGVASVTRDLVQLGGELNDVSEKLGISSEQVQILKFAAEQTGASFGSLQSAIQFNTKLVGEAARGNKAAAEALGLLGIEARTFANVPLDRRLTAIAERLARVEDPARRLDLAIKVLGRGSADLVPLLSTGAAGVKAFEQQLRKSNSILSNEQVRALDEAGDAWSAFILRLKASAAPTLVGIIELLKEVDAGFERSSKRNFDPGINTANALGAAVEKPIEPFRKGPQNRASRRRPELNDPAYQAMQAFGDLPESSGSREVGFKLEQALAMVDEALKASNERLKQAAEERRQIFDRGLAITTANLTPQEEYFAGLDEAEDLFRRGALGAEAYERQILALGEAYATAQVKQYEASVEGAVYLEQLAEAKQIIESVRTPFEAYGLQLEKIGKLQRENFLSSEEASRAVLKAGQDYAQAQLAISDANDELSDSQRKLFDELKTAANGFARDLTDVFFDTTQSIGDMFKDLAVTIAKALFTQAVTEPIVNSVLGAFGGSSLGGLFGGGRAAGGPVMSGRAYVVGERGPELFVPGRSGQIIPNGAGGGTPVQVNLTITSVDPQTAAQTIVQQERLVTGMVRRAMIRAGVRPQLA